MNKAFVLGNLTRDLKENESGKVAFSTLAVTTSDKDEDGKYKSTFIPLRFLGEKQVESAKKHLSKGTRIAVEGELRFDSYKTDDGDYKNNDYLIVRMWEFAGAKKDKEEKEEKEESKEDDFVESPDDDLPF